MSKNEVSRPQLVLTLEGNGSTRTTVKLPLFLAISLIFNLSVLASGLGAGEPQKSKPSSPGDLQRVIQKEFQRHNYKKVVEVYQEFIETHPGQFQPILSRVLYSQSLADVGQIDEAIRSLQEILADWPPQVSLTQIHYDLANLLFMQKRHKEAQEAYQKVIIQSAAAREISGKASRRLFLMKEKESKKRDVAAIQMLDIETSLEAGEVPDGGEAFLKKIAEQNQNTPSAERAILLLSKVRDVRTEKAKALLDEARRLYDEEKKYAEVREILEQIQAQYPDVSEQQSVEALLKAVTLKFPRSKRRDASGNL